MKKPVSKAEIRADLEQAVEAYLRRGGEVERVPRGTSGIADRSKPPAHLEPAFFIGPKAPRTPVPEVVAAIEARRRQPRPKHSSTRRRGSPKARIKTVYDDFGEPLRQVWVED